MENRFFIKENTLDGQKQIWSLQAVGSLPDLEVGEKLRVLAIFTIHDKMRRFPMDAVCFQEEDRVFFSVGAQIHLPDIFYRLEDVQENDEVCVSFAFCDTKGNWRQLGEENILLSAVHFLHRSRNASIGFRFYQWAAYAVCTLLLPVWLLDGYFAGKGRKTSPYLEEGVCGRRAMLYHAHGLVKQITGHGYSVREWKTQYFARQYQKACRRQKQPEKILFLSERCPDVGGNLDRVYRRLVRSGEKPETFIDTRPVHKLPFSKLRRAAVLAAGAKVIVLEDFYPQLHALQLREETRVVQLWHACGAFKMFGLSDIGKTAHLEQSTKNHRSYSAAIVSSRQMIPFYSEAFGIAEKNVLPLGVPRTDVFFDREYRDNVRRTLYGRYPSLLEKRVVLFAPTFRGGGNKDAYYPSERFLADDFLDGLPEDIMLIIKHHPFVKQRTAVSEQNRSRVLELTGKENINDLLFLTDLLITDYSSSIFEAALLSVPMLFYVFDLEEYMRTRDIYFDFASFAPGKQVREHAKLKSETVKLLSEGGGRDLEQFRKYFMGSLDGHSTERVTALIRQYAGHDTESM